MRHRRHGRALLITVTTFATAAGALSLATATNVLSEIVASVLGGAGLAILVVIGMVYGGVELYRRWTAPEPTGGETDDTAPGRLRDARTPGRSPLPYIDDFIGRTEEVQAIVGELRNQHAVAVIGRRGTGTSACALKAANLCRDEFPDGAHRIDLRDGGRPRSRYSLLVELAAIVGAPAPRSDQPVELTRAAHDLREYVDGRRLLLLLDNVDDLAQVRFLLPPTANACRLLLAGGPQLARLDGVAPYRLDDLSRPDAAELFFAAAAAAPGRLRRTDPRSGPASLRAGGAARAADRLVDLAGRQPGIIRELGRELARRGCPPMELAQDLERTVRGPHRLRTEPPRVVEVFLRHDVAYHALSRAARRLYRLMPLAPADLDRAAIEALKGRRLRRIGPALRELLDNELVEETSDTRYRIRPSLLACARLHLHATESARRQTAARGRLLRHLVVQAERQVARLWVAGGDTDAQQQPPASADDAAADWFVLHQRLLGAVIQSFAHEPPRRIYRWWFRLVVALCGWYAHAGQVDQWARTCDLVVRSPMVEHRTELAWWARNQLGVVRRRQGDPLRSIEEFTRALDASGHKGDAQILLNLGLAKLDLGRVEEAIEDLELSLRRRARADRHGRALSHLALGAAYLRAEHPDTALRQTTAAARLFRGQRDARGYAAALTNLVLVHTRLDEHLRAVDAWEDALREHELIAAPEERAALLLNAGAALVTFHPALAGRGYGLLTDSRGLRDGRRPTAGYARTLLHLGDAAELLGRHDEAKRHWTEAMEMSEVVGDQECRAAAEQRVGTAGRAVPRPRGGDSSDALPGTTTDPPDAEH